MIYFNKVGDNVNKKEKIIFIISITLIMSVVSAVTSYAVSSSYFYTGTDVGFDGTKSGVESDNVQGAIDELRARATDYNSIKEEINEIKSNMQPVGSIYCSKQSTNPNKFYGGTWTQIKDRFILAAGDTYTVGSTGGEATHTLTVSEMPSHNHTGTTGVGYVSSMRVVGAAGTSYASNHITGYASGSYNDITKTSNFPGANHTHSFTSNSTGGGGAHNNMPPYKVYYCFERTE